MSKTLTNFDVTEYWKTCLSTALVGTDRRAPVAPAGENPFAQLLQSLDWDQPASALLNATSAIAQYQAVGKPVGPLYESRPHIDSSETTRLEASRIEPCEPDMLPCCSDRVAKYLGITLLDYTEAVSELLELIFVAEQRVPPKYLPTLLSFGEKRTALQPLIVSVLGNRGRWLAAQNPRWRYACVPGAMESESTTIGIEAERLALQTQWETGSRKDRILAFQQWRRLDPVAAREALSENWQREPWRDREAFITAMTPQLSIEDEPFLEDALTDRAKSVKAYAAELLATMPNSQLCQRLAQYIQPFVQLHTQDSQLHIAVTLPETYEQTWENDGIERKPRNGEGERAGWLRQMIAKAPLSIWGAAPEDIVRAAATHEWREALVNGWAIAIHRQRLQPDASGWAIAWLHQFGAYDLDETVLTDLLLLLPSQQRAIYLRAQLPTKANDQNLAHWLRLTAQSNQRWDFEFSRLIVTQLITLLKGKPKYGDLFSPPITLALSLHPGVASESVVKIEQLLQTQYPTRAWQKFLDRFLGLLNLRWEIYQAFANSS